MICILDFKRAGRRLLSPYGRGVLLFFFLFATFSLSAQDYSVKGVVADSKGEPLIGVSIKQEDANIGTISDIDGSYSLKISSALPQIVTFSYIGYIPQSVAVKPGVEQEITMKEDNQTLEEVVVTALGIKREKKMLGYAIQDVKSSELNTTGDAQVMGALQGKVAGLQISSASTGMGGSQKITIRGNSSLTDDNQPLWIVDGVPFTESSTSSASLYGGVDRGSTVADINPEDIESVSVLKGPNAAALYGARAGNGVILVTTKKGTRKSGFGVDYSGTFTWTMLADALDMQKDYGQGSGGNYSPNSRFSFGPLLDDSEKTAWNGEKYPYSYYGNKMKDYFNTGFSQTHNVSIGNVSEKSNMRASFGYMNSDGMFNGESMRRINADLSAGTKINNYLSMDGKVSVSNTRAENRPFFGLYGELSQVMIIPNNVRLSDLENYSTSERMHVNWTGPEINILNPYYVNHQHGNTDERWRAFGYYNMKINFTEWLRFSAKYAFDYYNTGIKETNLSNGVAVQKKEDVIDDGMNRTEMKHFEQNAELFLSGENNLPRKFRINYMLGANFMYRMEESLFASVSNMLVKEQWMLNTGKKLGNVSDNGWERKMNSVFGSVSLSYNDYISLDITARNDWSSTLPSGDNSFFYPSANVGFVVSDMLKSLGISLPRQITFIKLRGSAAQVGKDPDVYLLQNYYNYEFVNGTGIQKRGNVKMNPDLKPEMRTSYEFGLDARFFDNRFGFDFTYYNGTTKNQTMKIAAPSPWSGGQYVNAGLIRNRGVEVMIYSTPVKTDDFRFDLNLNMSHNESIVESLHENKNYVYLNGDALMPVYVGAREGAHLGEIYAKRMLKRDESGNLVLNNGMPQVISDENYCLNNPIGNIEPKLLMSVAPSFSYKGFTLSALFDMRFGGDIVSVSEAYATSYGTSQRTADRGTGGNIILSGVNEDGTPNTTPISAESYYIFIGNGGTNAIAEEFVYDASYIRIKELSLGYTFSQKLLKKTKFITSARIAFVARNLWYLMKHTPGTSPEGGYDTSMFSQAIDFSAMPYSRTMGLSVALGF